MKCDVEYLGTTDLGWHRYRCVHCGRTADVRQRDQVSMQCGVARRPPPSTDGVGTRLQEALKRDLGISDAQCASCRQVMLEMNAAGVAGVRARRAHYAEHLRHAAEQQRWAVRLRAAAGALWSGLAWRLDPGDPYGSLVDEACRRQEALEGKIPP